MDSEIMETAAATPRRREGARRLRRRRRAPSRSPPRRAGPWAARAVSDPQADVNIVSADRGIAIIVRVRLDMARSGAPAPTLTGGPGSNSGNRSQYYAIPLTRPPRSGFERDGGECAAAVYVGPRDRRTSPVRWRPSSDRPEARSDPPLPAGEGTGRQDHRPDELRLPLGEHLRPCRNRLPTHRRLRRQRGVRVRHHVAGHDGGAHPAVPGGRARREAGVGDRRHAVRVVRGRAG